jgi:5-methyltetrahydropteroyltriglutamate--homocysteine methyltransferase
LAQAQSTATFVSSSGNSIWACQANFKFHRDNSSFMTVLVDDIGSFPLPKAVSSDNFAKAYSAARMLLAENKPLDDAFAVKTFSEVVLDSFRQKLRAGLDVVNYPQHLDGVRQVGEVIHKAMETGTFVVEEKDAFLPEVRVIEQNAKALSEEFGKQILLRVSFYGPMEQYLKEVGITGYLDVLEGFAETIRRFAKNSVLNNKYIKTEVVSIDEPSFGYLNINANSGDLCMILDRAFDFKGATRQIHLHSATRLPELLCLQNLDVVTFEYAASPQNIEGVSKKMLQETDKQVRVGIARTDIDSITAELYEQGITKPTAEQLVDSPQTIQKRYLFAKEKFGDALTFTGPDCGLGGWPSQEAASLLLERTVKTVKQVTA